MGETAYLRLVAIGVLLAIALAHEGAQLFDIQPPFPNPPATWQATGSILLTVNQKKNETGPGILFFLFASLMS